MSIIYNDLKRLYKKFDSAKVSTDFLFATVVEEGNPPILEGKDLDRYPTRSIIIPREFTDYEVEIERSCYCVDSPQSNLRETIKVFNHLKLNEKVVLLKQEGGQKLMVIARF